MSTLPRMNIPKIDLTAINERVADADRKTDRAAAHPGPIFDASRNLAVRASASDVPALLAHIAELQADLEAWNVWFEGLDALVNGGNK